MCSLKFPCRSTVLSISLLKYCTIRFPAKELSSLFPCKSTVQSMIKHHTVMLCFKSDQGFLRRHWYKSSVWLCIYSLQENATSTVRSCMQLRDQKQHSRFWNFGDRRQDRSQGTHSFGSHFRVCVTQKVQLQTQMRWLKTTTPSFSQVLSCSASPCNLISGQGNPRIKETVK